MIPTGCDDPAMHCGDQGEIDVEFSLPPSRTSICKNTSWADLPVPEARELEVRDQIGFVDIALSWEPIGHDVSARPLGDACFSVRVDDSAGRAVMMREHLCATSSGAAWPETAQLTWIAPCDAGSGAANGRVIVTLELACDKDGDAIDSADLPCAHGCSQDFVCSENFDEAVAFELGSPEVPGPSTPH